MGYIRSTPKLCIVCKVNPVKTGHQRSGKTRHCSMSCAWVTRKKNSLLVNQS